jgi:hypothetical protein
MDDINTIYSRRSIAIAATGFIALFLGDLYIVFRTIDVLSAVPPGTEIRPIRLIIGYYFIAILMAVVGLVAAGMCIFFARNRWRASIAAILLLGLASSSLPLCRLVLRVVAAHFGLHLAD